MRFSLTPILLPLVLIASFSFAVHWLATRTHDRGFAWATAVGVVIAAVLANALFVYATDRRIKRIEAKLERLSSKSSDDQSVPQ